MSTTRASRPQDEITFLNCRRLPARLTTGETAICLGFQEHDIAVLVAAKLLEPLGQPVANASKYFATIDVLALAGDRHWLARATKAVTKHWQTKNRRKKVAPLRSIAEAA